MGGVNDIVICVEVLFLPEIFDFASYGRALGMPEDKSATGIFLLFLFNQPIQSDNNAHQDSRSTTKAV